MTHSKKLEETALWKVYQEKLKPYSDRDHWIKNVYDTATTYLLEVRRVFENYTLHDATHVLNVLDAMSGILGDQITYLTIGEIELLILVACLHDLGMVYTREEELQYYNDKRIYQGFLRENCPEFLGCSPAECQKDIRQQYLRFLHPFRISQVLQHSAWKDLFANCPREVAPYRCILAICQAHGQAPEDFQGSRDMEYLESSDVDPLFCALLLRLADLLDFDDTRAPKILYSYVTNNEKSRKEWDKHQASTGFHYPVSPSTNKLPYKARCTNPGIEHAIRDFLDWIDDELDICIKLQKKCHADWQRNFPFPRAVSREEIESVGYMRGDFRLTMDQTRILELLAGRNLYENEDAFVRELLQNAMDATLLRDEMDQDFSLAKARIDLWEWTDADGYVWFRMDDMGTGMTLGMLQRYFLKVGNSYYSSHELKRDLRDHGRENYYGISHFGIGFLSCFLCGTFAEVSTLYFDSNKNRSEYSTNSTSPTTNYGLRLQVTGLTGYYTLQNQVEQPMVDIPLRSPDFFVSEGPMRLENLGYRSEPGTSITIRLDPGKLGAIDLRQATENYLCCARVPVYYNGVRIGRTYEELMRATHKIAGERLYRLNLEAQKSFDKLFPAIRGQYPKVVLQVIPIDTEEKSGISGLSGVIMKYDIRFDKKLQWKEKGQIYTVYGRFFPDEKKIIIRSLNINDGTDWSWYTNRFEKKDLNSLINKFAQFTVCPTSSDELGDIWLPFAKANTNLYQIWQSWIDLQQEKKLSISLEEVGCPSIDDLSQSSQLYLGKGSYRGVSIGRFLDGPRSNGLYSLFLLDDKWKPVVNTSIIHTNYRYILAQDKFSACKAEE